MKVLVLGAEGQIGAPLCHELFKLGHDVRKNDIKIVDDHDLRRNNEAWVGEIEDADFVFFLAYDVGGSKYLSKYQHTFEFLQNNTLMMCNVFSCLHKHKKPFIFTSSQMSKMSNSPYGAQKSLGEKYSHSLGGRVVRFWNVYGMEEEEEKAHVITDFIRMAVKDGVIRMMTDGKEKRQFLYAKDCAKALCVLMNRYDELDKDHYSVSSFEWTSVLEVAEIISELMPSKIEIISGSKHDQTHDGSYEDPSTYVLEYWQPKTSLSVGLSEMIRAEMVKK